MGEKRTYSIGEAAVISGISKKTLRYYDSIELIVPAERNPDNNYRMYTKEQVITLCIIGRLRKMDCSLAEIREAVREDNVETLLAQIEKRMNTLEEEIRYRRSIIDENRDFIARLREAAMILKVKAERPADYNEYLFSNMRVEYIPESKAYSVRRVMPNYNINETSIDLWAELLSSCEAAGYGSSGEAMAIYHCGMLEQFIAGDRELELCLSIELDGGEDGASETADGHIRTVGGYDAATAVYVGPYSGIIHTWLKLLQWINSNGYRTAGMAHERYLVAPTESFTQENQIVKIVIPIAKK